MPSRCFHRFTSVVAINFRSSSGVRHPFNTHQPSCLLPLYLRRRVGVFSSAAIRRACRICLKTHDLNPKLPEAVEDAAQLRLIDEEPFELGSTCRMLQLDLVETINESLIEPSDNLDTESSLVRPTLLCLFFHDTQSLPPQGGLSPPSDRTPSGGFPPWVATGRERRPPQLPPPAMRHQASCRETWCSP